MTLWELIMIAIGLSMDAFAVSIGKGLSMERLNRRKQVKIGFYFGGFQALMPVIGYYVGIYFRSFVESVDHWIAFALLVLIGIQMLREAKEEEEIDGSVGVKQMLILSIATSIDALAVGVSFAFLPGVNIWQAAASIGIITFFLSAIAVKIGNVFGQKYQAKASIFGGVILIGMGIKILIEHLFFS